MAGILKIRILSKPNCHLCDVAKEVVTSVVSHFPVEIETINIENDPALLAEFGYDIPVVFLNDRKIFKHRVDEQKLRTILESATSRL